LCSHFYVIAAVKRREASFEARLKRRLKVCFISKLSFRCAAWYFMV
jgi:hypothetical protein